jgi:thymidylate synthase ThyX
VSDPNQKTKAMYDDAWHRSHANHKNQPPTVSTDRGPYGLNVTLDTWGPNDGRLLATIYNQAQSNWGEEPSKFLVDEELGPKELAVIAHIMEGKHLQNALELISFGFTIEGCTRACTHEIVRTRVGASFAQHGGRDNDWRHRRWTVPEALARTFDAEPMETSVDPDELVRLFYEYAKIMGLDESSLEFLAKDNAQDILDFVLAVQKCFYAASADAGLAWQDARRILGIGHQTYIHANYNYIALRGVLAHRMEHAAVDWEIDCVAQLMLREVWLKCPRVIAASLGSHSDKARVNKFANLYSWPPNGKWPNPSDWDSTRKTTFRREQAPFWVLDPRCLVDQTRSVSWIPTNGSFPHKEYNEAASQVLAELERKI